MLTGTPMNQFAYLLLAVAPLCWAGNIVLARGVVELIPPVGFAFWRWTLAFLILLPFGWNRAAADLDQVLQHWKIMVFLGLTGITGFNTLLYTGVHTTTAINGALIQTAMPALVILISLAVFREKIGGLQILGVGFCMVGALLVILRGDLTTLLRMSFVRGDLIIGAAVVLYALYSALLRKRPPIHPLSFLVFSFGIGVAGLFPFYIVELAVRGGFSLGENAVLSILYVALFPGIVAYFCWNRGIDLIGPNRGGLFINLIPVLASGMAVVWLGETLRMYHLAGMALIFFGMVLFNRKESRGIRRSSPNR
jgi:drug/metabolite transporter (DMT)-like permease